MNIELKAQERLDDLIKSGRKIIQNEAEMRFCSLIFLITGRVFGCWTLERVQG